MGPADSICELYGAAMVLALITLLRLAFCVVRECFVGETSFHGGSGDSDDRVEVQHITPKEQRKTPKLTKQADYGMMAMRY